MKKIKYIIIHHSDSKWGSKKEIDKWHKAKGWRGCGYSYIVTNGRITSKSYNIKNDGLLEVGRKIDNDQYLDIEEKGAHAYGFNNKSIGVCLIGKDKFTPKQFETLIYLLLFYKKLWPGIKIIGHSDISEKVCPNFNIELLNNLINRYTLMSEIRLYFHEYF